MQELDESKLKPTGPSALHLVTLSHAVFAVVLIGLGVLGLIKGDFAPGWTPVPESTPARQALAYLCDVVYLACGVGLLWRRTAAIAARILFVYLLLWMLVLRLPWMVTSFQVGTWWPAGSTAVLLGTAWMRYISVTSETQTHRFGSFTGDKSLRIARTLFGLGLIPFGLAHFLYLEATAPLVPAWMQWPVFWSYFTGGAFIAAGLAIISGVFARLAALLTTLQFAMLTLLVWAPRIIEGNLTPFQTNEFFVSILLTAAAWVVAASYRGPLWPTMRRR